jgi:CRISPR-associated protein Cas1
MTQPRSGPRLLITDREGALLLERARIHVEGDRVVYHAADDERRREYNIPHANLAVLFLGQGTSITQEAARLLAEEGVHVAFTGTGGTPLHLGSLTTYHAPRHFREMLPIYLDPVRSLAAAKAVMSARVACMRETGVKHARKWMGLRDADPILRICGSFEKSLLTINSIQELLGHEGQFTKACYAEFARLAGLSNKDGGFRREAGTASGPGPATLVNGLIDHGNYLCYGMAGAALWALGIPPHLAVFHGKTRAGGLVFDLADGFKDAFVLPAAFCAPRKKNEDDPEAAFRGRMISAFDDERVLAQAIATVEAMLKAGGSTEAAAS